MKQGFNILALAVACLFLSQNLRADILKGRVVDADTGEPLQGAEVVFNEESLDIGSVMRSTIRTDSMGHFVFACKMEMSRRKERGSYRWEGAF